MDEMCLQHKAWEAEQPSRPKPIEPDSICEEYNRSTTAGSPLPTTPMLPDTNDPSSGSPSDKGDFALDAVSGTSEDVRTLIRQDLRSGRFDIPTYQGHQSGEGPATLSPLYKFSLRPSPLRHDEHRQQTSHPFHLPDRNHSFSTQIVEHVGDWAEWGTRIPNEERRKEALDCVFDTLTKIWYEALRLGYDPGAAVTAFSQTPSMKVATGRGKKSTLRSPQQRPRQRKETSPSRMPFLMSRSHGLGPGWAVSFGELHEAGLSEKQVAKRAASGSLQEGEALLAEALETLGGEITTANWERVTQVTKANIWGRDLFLYALYEIVQSRTSIAHLQDLYESFSTLKQRENTQKRIDEEQQRHDLFMALALEINDPTTSPTSPDPSDGQSRREGSLIDGEELLEKQKHLQDFVHLIEALLEETDDTSLVTVFENSPFSYDDLIIEMSEDTATNLDRSKKALNDLLSHAKESTSKLSGQELQTVDFDTNLDLCSEIQQLEEQIGQRKQALTAMLSLLNAELDATMSNKVCEDDSVVIQDAAIGELSSPPNDERSVDETALPEATASLSKRSVDITDEAGMPERKKQKVANQREMSRIRGDGDKEGNHESLNLVDAANSDARQALCSVGALEGEHEQFIKTNVVPKVNEIFVKQGDLPTATTPWNVLRGALERAGASTEQRDALASEINARGCFVEEADASRGSMEEESSCRLTGVDDLKRPSLVVTLRLGSSFDPAELSSKALFAHKGFQYRYTTESTLTQRRSMDEILDTYVRDWTKSSQVRDNTIRFGSYVILAHPDDSERTSIIHGVWNMRDGSQAEEHAWFYRDITQPRHNDSSSGEDQNKSVLNPKLKTIIRLRNADSNRTVDTTNSTRFNKRTGNKKRDAPRPGTKSSTSFSRANVSSANRPKRHRARKSYAESDDDDEYCPSD